MCTSLDRHRDDQSEMLMAKSAAPTLLQGTLDLLILHALARGKMHGYAIAQCIHMLSDEALRVEEGSLYPALYRLELDGAIKAKWGSRRTTAGPNITRSPGAAGN